MRRALGLGVLLVFYACGSDGNGTDSSSSSSSSSTGSSSFGTPDGSPIGPDGCAEAAKLVYVVSAQDELYSFKPDKPLFTKIGKLTCPAPAGKHPNSMAVDRSGTAWINYSDGTLWKVNTVDASCAATTFQAGQSSFFRFGMAFSSNAAGSSEETLFVSGVNDQNKGVGLGKIDLGTMKLLPIGDYTGNEKGKGAELTGTGDARLFGFFTLGNADPATLAQIDKATAATSAQRSLVGVSNILAWAFSFWGGDFWFYTATTGTTPSKVTQLRTATDNSLSVVMQPEAVGFTIVGAGVSTCAPIAPVN